MANGNDVARRTYLYAFDKTYHLIRYVMIPWEHMGIDNLLLQAGMLRSQYNDVRYVYAADNSYDLYEACRDAMRTGLEQDHIVLKVLVETRGMLVP